MVGSLLEVGFLEEVSLVAFLLQPLATLSGTFFGIVEINKCNNNFKNPDK